MARIKIKDIDVKQKVSKQEMQKISGGRSELNFDPGEFLILNRPFKSGDFDVTGQGDGTYDPGDYIE